MTKTGPLTQAEDRKFGRLLKKRAACILTEDDARQLTLLGERYQRYGFKPLRDRRPSVKVTLLLEDIRLIRDALKLYRDRCVAGVPADLTPADLAVWRAATDALRDRLAHHLPEELRDLPAHHSPDKGE